ncbi:MAG: aspartyl protease family protein [Sphingomonas sp.]|uniref:aspartyl protease family protein n=1 Tax=Sphingomonas sp. TaxID=28214 RepID=UPI001ACB1826|nr:retroviral-like aspartic protease family protein [Sphingomonas sp.]MBN8809406.1 aspartyl protease family protein [Sphingomonas sp.]
MRSISAIAASCLLLSTHAMSSVPLTPAGNGHLVVPAFVNGKGTVPFVLDTGADGSHVYEWFARQQGLKPGTPINVEGMTGAAMMPTYRLDSITVDGRTIRNVDVTGLPDRKDAEITAGVTGNDLMDGAIAIFDFPCRLVTLRPKPVSMRRILTKDAVMIHGGTVVEGTQLTLPVTVNGAAGIAVLDTGSRGTQINPAFARAAHLDVDGPSFRPGETIYGAASKATETREGRVKELAFAGRRVNDLTVRVADLSVFRSFGIGNGPAMILGINAMMGQRLVYDHQAKRFWFDRPHCKASA